MSALTIDGALRGSRRGGAGVRRGRARRLGPSQPTHDARPPHGIGGPATSSVVIVDDPAIGCAP